jgi:hypothetical protein
MPNVKEVFLSEIVTTNKKVEYVNVSDDVVIYRITAETKTNSSDLGVHVTEGITSISNVDQLKKGFAPRYAARLVAAIGTPEFKKHIRQFGWMNDKIYAFIDEVTSSPFAKFELGSVEPSDIIFIEDYSHEMHDFEMKPLPVAIKFDYINGCMDNTRYNLQKAIDILKARGDIRFMCDERWVDDPASILNIPGYNCDGKRNRYISFVWMPEVDDYRAMVTKSKEIGGKYPSTNKHQAVFDLDTFGLRAAGAAKYEKYYDSDPTENDEDEYDY